MSSEGTPSIVNNLCFSSVQGAFAAGRSHSISAFLLLELFLKFGKLCHGHLFFLIQNLLDALDLYVLLA